MFLIFQGPTSCMPNGIIGPQSVKGMTSLNHVGPTAVTESLVSHDGTSSPLLQVAPLTDTTLSTLEHHLPVPSKHSKSMLLPFVSPTQTRLVPVSRHPVPVENRSRFWPSSNNGVCHPHRGTCNLKPVYWCTHQERNVHALTHGTSVKRPCSPSIRCIGN